VSRWPVGRNAWVERQDQDTDVLKDRIAALEGHVQSLRELCRVLQTERDEALEAAARAKGEG
jgi:cell division protein FtsB